MELVSEAHEGSGVIGHCTGKPHAERRGQRIGAEFQITVFPFIAHNQATAYACLQVFVAQLFVSPAMILPHRPLIRHLFSEESCSWRIPHIVLRGQVGQRLLDEQRRAPPCFRIGRLGFSERCLRTPFLLGIRGRQHFTDLVEIRYFQGEDKGVACIRSPDEAAAQSASHVAQIIANLQTAIFQLVARRGVERRAPSHERRRNTQGNVVLVREVVGQARQHIG